MKYLFTCDIHANKKRNSEITKLFRKLKDIIVQEKIDYFVIGGDLWDNATVNSKASGFTDVINAISEISKITKVYAIYGTPTHEVQGSLDVLKLIGVEVFDKTKLITDDNGNKLMFVPELRRCDFISSSIEETTSKMIESLENDFKNNVDVVFYHGDISGSVLQNGLKNKSEVMVTKQMIDNCGAKLMLAGHVHSPQQVFNNVMYAGSPVPCNFGETHRGSVIVFEMHNHSVFNINKIDTGFPQNRTIEFDNLDSYKKIYNFSFKNQNIKIKLKLTQEEKLIFNIKNETKKIKEITGAEKVTFHVDSVKTISVRSKEISKAKSILEKLNIYASINNIFLSDIVKLKAKQLEESLLTDYTFPIHSFELISLSLRGAKGLKNKEEIFIDFSEYSDGILALVGDNGSGKTTLLENMSPYPKLLTRSGTLKYHFYLKDSHRIVVFKDENGLYYKFSILLAAHCDSGLVKYFAETSKDCGKSWTKVDGVDGSLDAYSNYVKSLFGSVEMYLRTAFFTKSKIKGMNDIATSTKSERISLISQLIGIDELTELHSLAKEKANEFKSKLDKIDNSEEELQNIDNSISEKKQRIKRCENDIKSVEDELTRIEKELSKNKKLLDDFNSNYGKYKNLIELKTETENRISELSEHLDKLTEHKKKNDYYINHKSKIEEFIDTYNKLKPLEESFQKISKRYKDISSKLMQDTENYNNLKTRVDVEKSKYDGIDERIRNIENNLIDISDKCPTCGAKLSAEKRKQLASARNNQMSEIDALNNFKQSQKEIVSDLKKQLASAKDKYQRSISNSKEITQEYEKIESEISFTKAYLEHTDLYDFVDYIPVTNLEDNINDIKKELNSKKDFLSTFGNIDYVDYEEIISNLESERKQNENFRIKFSMDLATEKTELKQIENSREKLMKHINEVSLILKEYEEYSLLEKAFSNTGIQALEIESAVPDIAMLANQILYDSYGDKFTLEFKTLKESKNKLVEDFSIEVTNHETGWTTPVEMISEGEKVWITQSLYYAFSLIRMERTGFNFKIRFIDESDGALDNEARIKYLNMISSVHKSGNNRLTVLITHSQEIKDIVDQTINL